MESNLQLLGASDYEYLLPDHWLPASDFAYQIVRDYYVGRVVDLIVSSGAKSVLEVGCGDGWNCGKLVHAGLQVVGIDWSKNGIDHARRMVPKGQFLCCDVTSKEFKDAFPAPFDAIIMVEVLEHIPPSECVRALKNIIAHLKPGGRFVLTTPSVNVVNTNPQHYRHFDEKVLISLLSEVGDLVIESMEGYGDSSYQETYYKRARWVNNRFYTVRPVHEWLVRDFQMRCSIPSSFERCSGFVVSMRKGQAEIR